MVISLYPPTRFFSCPTDTGVGSTQTLFIWGTFPRVFQPLRRKSATPGSQPGFHATQNLDMEKEGKGVFVGQTVELRAAASGSCRPSPPRARVSIGLSSPFPPSILCTQVLVTFPFLTAQITKPRVTRTPSPLSLVLRGHHHPSVWIFPDVLPGSLARKVIGLVRFRCDNYFLQSDQNVMWRFFL